MGLEIISFLGKNLARGDGASLLAIGDEDFLSVSGVGSTGWLRVEGEVLRGVGGLVPSYELMCVGSSGNNDFSTARAMIYQQPFLPQQFGRRYSHRNQGKLQETFEGIV